MDTSRRTPGDGLMDQCSRHDIPLVLTGNLTSQPGHGLTSENPISV